MTTDQTRDDAWYELLDIARLVRYYEAMSDRYRRSHRTVRFLLLAAAASGIATVVELLPATMQYVSGGLVALLVMWDFVSDYAEKAAVLHAISVELSNLEIERSRLWAAVNNPDTTDDEVQQTSYQLARRLSEVTAWAGLADIREDRKLNEQCEASAYNFMSDRYAH